MNCGDDVYAWMAEIQVVNNYAQSFLASISSLLQSCDPAWTKYVPDRKCTKYLPCVNCTV